MSPDDCQNCLTAALQANAYLTEDLAHTKKLLADAEATNQRLATERNQQRKIIAESCEEQRGLIDMFDAYAQRIESDAYAVVRVDVVDIQFITGSNADKYTLSVREALSLAASIFHATRKLYSP